MNWWYYGDWTFDATVQTVGCNSHTFDVIVLTSSEKSFSRLHHRIFLVFQTFCVSCGYPFVKYSSTLFVCYCQMHCNVIGFETETLWGTHSKILSLNHSKMKRLIQNK